MPKLYHYTLDPHSRRMRLALAEYGVIVHLAEEKPWAPTQTLLSLNPAGTTPVLVDDSGFAVCGTEAVTEYLEETRSSLRKLLPGNATLRAEIRRLISWFDLKFYTEVTEPLLTEKVLRRFMGAGNASSPDMNRVRAAKQMLKGHMDYVAMLAEERSWLAGNDLSLADLAAAAHISAIDYLGDIAWADYPVAAQWYSRIKSRPSFRSLLSDTVPGLPPSEHYANLDF